MHLMTRAWPAFVWSAVHVRQQPLKRSIFARPFLLLMPSNIQNIKYTDYLGMDRIYIQIQMHYSYIMKQLANYVIYRYPIFNLLLLYTYIYLPMT